MFLRVARKIGKLFPESILRPPVKMSSGHFYAVACGKNPGVYYSWEECSKEVQNFPNAVYKKFLREKDAWDFVKANCRDVRLTAGHSPAKIKLNTNNSDLDGNVKTKILERLQAIQEKIDAFHENVIREINAIKEEFLARSVPPPAKRTLLIAVEDAPPPKEYPNKRPMSTHLPSTSKRCLQESAENISVDDQISTFRVDSDGYVEVYTDGACANNGSNDAKAGVGVWFGDGHSLNISEPVRGRITNNSAEIEAATLAIEAAALAGCIFVSKYAEKYEGGKYNDKHMDYPFLLGIKKLKVFTDSSFLISAITIWISRWKKNDWKTVSGEPVKNKEEIILLDQAREKLDVVFVHVKGHAGNYENEQADALARAGAAKYIPFHKR